MYEDLALTNFEGYQTLTGRGEVPRTLRVMDELYLNGHSSSRGHHGGDGSQNYCKTAGSRQ